MREVKKLTIDAVMNQEKILKEDLEALKRLENCREEIEKLLYQDVSIDIIIDSILTLLKEIRTMVLRNLPARQDLPLSQEHFFARL